MNTRITRIDSNQSQIQDLRTRLQALETEYTICFDIQRRVTLLKEIESMKQEISELETSISRYLGHLTPGQLDYLTRVGAQTPEDINRALVEYEKLYHQNIKTLDAQRTTTGTVSRAIVAGNAMRNFANLRNGTTLLNTLENSYLFDIHRTKPNLPNGNILTLSDDATNACLTIPKNGTRTSANGASWLKRFGRSTSTYQKGVDKALEEAAKKGTARVATNTANGTSQAASTMTRGQAVTTLADDVASQTSNLLKNQGDDILRETTKQAKHLKDVATATQAASQSLKGGWGAAFKGGWTKGNVALTVGAAVISTGFEAADDIREHGHLTKRTAKAAVEETGGAIGALACMGVGAKIGAAVGTAIPVPVVGTVVGFVVGAAVGAAGYYIGKGIGKGINYLCEKFF